MESTLENMKNIKIYFLTQLNMGSPFSNYFKVNLLSLMILKILKIFADISFEHPISVLSHYVFLQDSWIQYISPKICIYLQIDIFFYKSKPEFSLTAMRKP